MAKRKTSKLPASHRSKTRLDQILDQVQPNKQEVRLYTDGYTREQVDRVLAAARARGLHAAADRHSILIRDLRGMHLKHAPKKTGNPAKPPTYKAAQSIIMDALEQYGGWKVERTSAQGKSLKIPHATLRPYRLYFKSQSIYLSGGPPPFSLNDARSMHVDPREVAMQPPERIHTIIREYVDHYSGYKGYSGNPMPGVPGGSISACIATMKKRKGVDDPGALCGWIARERGESRKRKKNGKNKKVSLRGVMFKALR